MQKNYSWNAGMRVIFKKNVEFVPLCFPLKHMTALTSGQTDQQMELLEGKLKDDRRGRKRTKWV